MPVTLLAVFAAVLAWSGWAPADRFTWVLEVLPAVAAAVLLILTRRRFPLSGLLYGAVFAHALILLVGGHYTYAEVPAGNWVRDALGLARNPYDRLGHLAQGFVPALVAREILLRCTPLRRGGWLVFLVLSVCLGISALYELFEWGAVMVTGAKADAFMGSQGDPWDAQWDMACALLGACMALALLGRAQDRSMARLTGSPGGPVREA